MEPIAPHKSIIDQLNAFCQSDVKTNWTLKRLRTNREVCGFSYMENDSGEWVLMPLLCTNCQHTLDQAIAGIISFPLNSKPTLRGGCEFRENAVTVSDKLIPGKSSRLSKKLTKTVSETSMDRVHMVYPSPLTSSAEYLLYPADTQNHTENQGLEFYRPSLASSGCCHIL